jgi:hypothetical protein
MAGPLMSAPVAQQTIQQKLPEAASQQSNKVGGSKFDGMMAQKAQQAEAASAAQKAQGAAQVEKARMDPSRLSTIKANRVDHARQVPQQTMAQRVGLQNDLKTLQQTVGSEGPKGQNIAVKMMGDIEKGQGVMDRLISEGLSGRHFQNSELLALQAGMYKYTQELELTGKVVEKATSGLKDTLKTQV